MLCLLKSIAPRTHTVRNKMAELPADIRYAGLCHNRNASRNASKEDVPLAKKKNEISVANTLSDCILTRAQIVQELILLSSNSCTVCS